MRPLRGSGLWSGWFRRAAPPLKAGTRPRLYGGSGQLAEVPADHAVGDEPEPGVAAVVDGFVPVEVLPEEQALGGFQVGIGLGGAGDLPDDGDGARQFDAAQFAVVVAGVDQGAHAGVTVDVGPALRPDEGIEPQAAVVPHEPQRVRA